MKLIFTRMHMNCFPAPYQCMMQVHCRCHTNNYFKSSYWYMSYKVMLCVRMFQKFYLQCVLLVNYSRLGIYWKMVLSSAYTSLCWTAMCWKAYPEKGFQHSGSSEEGFVCWSTIFVFYTKFQLNGMTYLPSFAPFVRPDGIIAGVPL